MQIAMLAWESMHSVAVGGLAPHVTELSSALQRRGHQVHVYTRVGPGQSHYDLIDGVHYHRCPFAEHPDFIENVERMCDSFIWHLGETEHFLGKRFDVIHGHDWLSTRAVERAKNDLHSHTIFTVHSTEYGRCGNTIWDDGMSRHIRDLEWVGTYVADRVICVSQSLRREVGELYSVPEDKTFSVYNGVKVGKFDVPVNTASVRRHHDIGVDEPFVLFAGRVTWQKGPDLLLEAIPGVLDDHPDCQIVYAGDGDMRPALEARALKMGIQSNTRFLGHRGGHDLVGLFKSADIVCVPSRNEPFGIVILEAWSAHKPVVATRTGGPAEFVTHQHNGLTVPLNVQSIGEGLGSLLADMDQARQMGRNGRIEAESRFSWDNSAMETEKVYRSIVEANGHGKVLDIDSQEEITGMPRAINGKSKSTDGKPQRTMGPSSVATQERTVSGPTDNQIRQRAYEIYLSRKGASGDPQADWLQAERELRQELSSGMPMARKRK